MGAACEATQPVQHKQMQLRWQRYSITSKRSASKPTRHCKSSLLLSLSSSSRHSGSHNSSHTLMPLTSSNSLNCPVMRTLAVLLTTLVAAVHR